MLSDHEPVLRGLGAVISATLLVVACGGSGDPPQAATSMVDIGGGSSLDSSSSLTSTGETDAESTTSGGAGDSTGGSTGAPLDCPEAPLLNCPERELLEGTDWYLRSLSSMNPFDLPSLDQDCVVAGIDPQVGATTFGTTIELECDGLGELVLLQLDLVDATTFDVAPLADVHIRFSNPGIDDLEFIQLLAVEDADGLLFGGVRGGDPQSAVAAAFFAEFELELSRGVCGEWLPGAAFNALSTCGTRSSVIVATAQEQRELVDGQEAGVSTAAFDYQVLAYSMVWLYGFVFHAEEEPVALIAIVRQRP